MKSTNHCITAVALAALLVLVAAACGRFQSGEVDLTVAHHEEPSDLAFGSEYLARVTVQSDPTAHVIDDEAKLVLMTSVVTIEDVYAQRPDAAALSAGEVIRVGISLLDANAGASIAETYPTTVEALSKDASVLLFFADAAEYPNVDGPLYESSGYAIIDKDNQVLWKGFSGGLAGTKADLASTVADVLSDFESTWANRAK